MFYLMYFQDGKGPSKMETFKNMLTAKLAGGGRRVSGGGGAQTMDKDLHNHSNNVSGASPSNSNTRSHDDSKYQNVSGLYST